MTVFELYKLCSDKLSKGGICDSSLDARLIVEDVCKIKHSNFLFERDRQASDEEIETCFALFEKRISGIPVQYILGKWEFMSLEFCVGEGVLIPRPETEQLCEYVIDKIKDKKSLVVFDLCSGSGCIGLSIKHYAPNAQVYLIEKSDKAIHFLETNRIRLSHARDMVSVKGDILGGYERFSFLPKPDVIVSNPPYIKTDEITTLQKEVQKEPVMALDGGEDGYVFYRALSQKWLPHINKGGFIAVECGEKQAGEISSMFLENSDETEIIRDFNHIERFVAAFKN